MTQELKKCAWVLTCLLGTLLLMISYYMSRGRFMDGGFSLFIVLFSLGAICLSVFIFWFIQKNKLLFLAGGMVYAALGAYLLYYFNYKNDSFLSGVAVFAAINAVLICISLIFSFKFINKQSQWAVLLMLLPMAAGISAYIYISIKAESRVAYLLQTQPVSYTVATVTKVKHYSIYSKYGRRANYVDALLEYTINGTPVYRVIDNKTLQYTMGTRVQIKYLLAQPDMFEIMQTVNSD